MKGGGVFVPGAGQPLAVPGLPLCLNVEMLGQRGIGVLKRQGPLSVISGHSIYQVCAAPHRPHDKVGDLSCLGYWWVLEVGLTAG